MRRSPFFREEFLHLGYQSRDVNDVWPSQIQNLKLLHLTLSITNLSQNPMHISPSVVPANALTLTTCPNSHHMHTGLYKWSCTLLKSVVITHKYAHRYTNSHSELNSVHTQRHYNSLQPHSFTCPWIHTHLPTSYTLTPNICGTLTTVTLIPLSVTHSLQLLTAINLTTLRAIFIPVNSIQPL